MTFTVFRPAVLRLENGDAYHAEITERKARARIEREVTPLKVV